MIAGLLLLALQAAAPATNLCALCHPDVRVQFASSVHRMERIACVDCHGGDSRSATVEGAHRGTFRPLNHRREIPGQCAACHADIARMRPYNLPADQYALYQTSEHGLRLARGDESVAVCTDCHGAHDIRRTDDPQSAVFPLNIPATCGRCHGKDGPAGQGQGLANPLTDYLAGVHGRAFIEDGNASSPHCSRCHGAHGATPVGIGDVDKVCGQCHATARAYFLESPHATALRDSGRPECASCHGSHRIAPAGVGMLDDICLSCHEEGSPQVAMAETMKTLVTNASDEIDQAEVLVARGAAVPLYVEDYEARLQEARSALTESLPLLHALDVDRVEQLTSRSRSIAFEVESEVEGKLQERRWQRVGLMLFWFYLLLTVALLVRFRRRAVAQASR